MNFFEKIKLKTTLRNCDYKLAGKVIRQQFYVSGRDAEINRLIDEYDLNPCFESAIKLIDHNELLVFYFTESCSGGLYIRQSDEQTKSNKVDFDLSTDEDMLGSPVNEPVVEDTMSNRFSFNPQKMAAKVVDPDKIQHLEESYNWMKDMISKQSGKQAVPITSDETEGNLELPLEIEDSLQEENELGKQNPVTKRQSQPKDIEQINLAIDHEDLDSETATLVIDTTSFNLSELKKAEKAKAKLAQLQVQEQIVEDETTVEEVNLSVDGFEDVVEEEVYEEAKAEVEEIVVTKPKREIEVFYETAPLESLPDWVSEVDEDAIIATAIAQNAKKAIEPVELPPISPAKAMVSDMIGTNPPNMDTAPLKSILEEVKAEIETTRVRPPLTFTNLISTIQLDIDTMRKQLNDYKRELRINPWDSDQLQTIIYSLEDAIYEFNEAIRILNENKSE